MKRFLQDGNYAGFDDKEFTSRSGGKYKAIMHIKVRLCSKATLLYSYKHYHIHHTQSTQPSIKNNHDPYPITHMRHLTGCDKLLNILPWSREVLSIRPWRSVLAAKLASTVPRVLQGLYFLLLEHNNCAWLQKEFGCSKMVMVGDGATDLEARRDGGADGRAGPGRCRRDRQLH